MIRVDKGLDSKLALSLLGREAPNDLIVDRQEITRIGNLCEISHIRKLNISFNPIKSLDGIDQLPQLRHIFGYSCEIENIDNLNKTPRLEVLLLQQNCISKIPETFKSLQKLQELRLDRNRLTKIECLTNCSALQRLNLSSNKITSLEGLSGLQNLLELDVSNNLIKSLSGLKALPSIKELDISGNQLKSLEGLHKFPTLETIKANHNQIISLNLNVAESKSKKAALEPTQKGSKDKKKTKELADLSSPILSDIFVSGNKIKSISLHENYCCTLEIIDLRNNAIDNVNDILPSLLKCKNLTELQVQGNNCVEDREAMKLLADTLSSSCDNLRAIDATAIIKSAPGRFGATVVEVDAEGSVSDSLQEFSQSTTRVGFHTWEEGSVDSSSHINSSSLLPGAKRRPSVAVVNEKNSDSEEEEEKESAQEDSKEEDLPVDNVIRGHLSLKDMLTPEQIIEKEDKIRNLLEESKMRLAQSVFTFGEKEFLKKVEEEYEKTKEEEEEEAKMLKNLNLPNPKDQFIRDNSSRGEMLKVALEEKQSFKEDQKEEEKVVELEVKLKMEGIAAQEEKDYTTVIPLKESTSEKSVTSESEDKGRKSLVQRVRQVVEDNTPVQGKTLSPPADNPTLVIDDKNPISPVPSQSMSVSSGASKDPKKIPFKVPVKSSTTNGGKVLGSGLSRHGTKLSTGNVSKVKKSSEKENDVGFEPVLEVSTGILTPGEGTSDLNPRISLPPELRENDNSNNLQTQPQMSQNTKEYSSSLNNHGNFDDEIANIRITKQKPKYFMVTSPHDILENPENTTETEEKPSVEEEENDLKTALKARMRSFTDRNESSTDATLAGKILLPEKDTQPTLRVPRGRFAQAVRKREDVPFDPRVEVPSLRVQSESSGAVTASQELTLSPRAIVVSSQGTLSSRPNSAIVRDLPAPVSNVMETGKRNNFKIPEKVHKDFTEEKSENVNISLALEEEVLKRSSVLPKPPSPFLKRNNKVENKVYSANKENESKVGLTDDV